MPTTVCKQFQFHAAHSIMGHPKCGVVHGHTYTVEVVWAGPVTDGMVIDFSAIKKTLGQWIKDTLDHAYIAQKGDPVAEALEALNKAGAEPPHRIAYLDGAPTAEMIAQFIAEEFERPMTSARVVSVTVHETRDAYARFEIPT